MARGRPGGADRRCLPCRGAVSGSGHERRLRGLHRPASSVWRGTTRTGSGPSRDYEALRKENTDALADLCIENFIEMRDRVGSRVFLLKKKLEVLLHRLFPRWYLPLYTLVTFTRTPYAEALRRVQRQKSIVRTFICCVLTFVLVILFVVLWK